MQQYIFPFDKISASDWSQLSNIKKISLTKEEIEHLRSLCDPIDIFEVEKIYGTLLEYISLLYSLFANYHKKTNYFFNNEVKVPPFIIGIAGSVSVGKSTMARILQILLKRDAKFARVELITTDGFLYPNAVLQKMNKMKRKGFPDSYNVLELIKLLSDLKSSKPDLSVPLYSHFYYDVLKDRYKLVDFPQIVIVEGINVLQVYDLKAKAKYQPFVSDFFDLSIYVDADCNNIKEWYLNRFLMLRKTSFSQKGSYFKKYSDISEEQALEIANDLWHNVNEKNLFENILPSKTRADLCFYKGVNHLVEYILVKRK